MTQGLYVSTMYFSALRSTSGGPGAKTLEIEQVERGSIEGQAQWRRPSAQAKGAGPKDGSRIDCPARCLLIQPPSATRRAQNTSIHRLGAAGPACLSRRTGPDDVTQSAGSSPASLAVFLQQIVESLDCEGLQRCVVLRARNRALPPLASHLARRETSSSTERWKDVPRGTMDEVSSHVALDLPFV